jgi:DNA-directed RNA polymerase subunit alpha
MAALHQNTLWSGEKILEKTVTPVPAAVIAREPVAAVVKAVEAPVSVSAASNKVTLEGLGLTTRVLHSLKEEGVDSVDALIALSEKDLKKVPGVGERSLDEIKKQLAMYSLELKD